ncbi:hypothetical protein [Lysinibacillus irui]|uniref:hypothetical protein n=1 Tax=Lysinibacillus irui TaxID=2998077 RepID=UPI002AD46754|nr:hypothetical protein [Lysinibacillus irui]MEA0565545.1 hypothetical protein [Lysinibacillus irui]
MVTKIVIDRTLQFLKEMAKQAVVTIDGQDSIVSFHSQEIIKDTVKTYVYIENGHGKVTAAKLVDSQGIELDRYTTSIEPSEEGLMIVFTLSVTLKGELQV